MVIVHSYVTGWWCNNHLEKWWSSSMGRMTSHWSILYYYDIVWLLMFQIQTDASMDRKSLGISSCLHQEPRQDKMMLWQGATNSINWESLGDAAVVREKSDSLLLWKQAVKVLIQVLETHHGLPWDWVHEHPKWNTAILWLIGPAQKTEITSMFSCKYSSTIQPQRCLSRNIE